MRDVSSETPDVTTKCKYYDLTNLLVRSWVWVCLVQLDLDTPSLAWLGTLLLLCATEAKRTAYADVAIQTCLHFSICACHTCAWGHANLLCIVPIVTDDLLACWPACMLAHLPVCRIYACAYFLPGLPHLCLRIPFVSSCFA